MSNQTSDNNKRIAKNTLLLYLRMFFTMAVSLYTSRAVLNTLGVVDYGVYNVVGGIVVVFSFVNGAMATATQRYITFALGKQDENWLKTVFSTSLQIHLMLSVAVVLLTETIGLWFLYNKMQIPVDRISAAFWVLQCSIGTSVIMILSVPYNATIIAHERMSAFAYISVLEVILKLAIVFLLLISPFDKLIFYAILFMLVQLGIRICYSTYCQRHFKETIYRRVWNKSLFKEMLGFAGWNVFGNMAGMLSAQGVNLILNVFFGPAINAARGLAVQVQTAIEQFAANFQMAANPQITKTYAQGDLESMHKLIIRTSRITFFLLFMFTLPLFFYAEGILKLWLKIVPQYTAIFLQLSLLVSIVDGVAYPLMTGAQATGKIRKFLTVIAVIALMIAPVSYVVLKLGAKPYMVYVVHLVICSSIFVVRLYLIKPLINLNISQYYKGLFSSIFPVAFISTPIAYFISVFMKDTHIVSLFFGMGLCILVVLLTTYLCGLEKRERMFVNNKLSSVLCKVKH